MSTQNINELLSLREKALTMRHKSQVKIGEEEREREQITPWDLGREDKR